MVGDTPSRVGDTLAKLCESKARMNRVTMPTPHALTRDVETSQQ